MDLNDRMLVNALGPLGEQIVAIPPAPDLANWTSRVKAGMDLAGYLAAVEAFLLRYVAFPSEHEAVAIALWVAHAWQVECFETSPILAVTSAEMQSGKTRVLDCLELLVPNPQRMVMPSEAVTFSVLARRPRPTLLLDEVDAFFGPRPSERQEGIRAILNAGNRQGTPVLRVSMNGQRREVEEFDIYGAKAIAGIGNLPSTVTDRSIPVRMKRRAPTEPVASFRSRKAREEAKGIVFPMGIVTDVTDVPVPEELRDRAADCWEPLLSIADAAGNDWHTRARASALALSADATTEVSIGVRLLADIRDAFDDLKVEYLPTASLLDWLNGLEEAPWGDWYGKPLSGRGLARLLAPYRVRPLQRRVHGQPQRGYFASEFTDAWARYVAVGDPGTSGTSSTSGTGRFSDDAAVPGS
ncbi:MAG: DUF3631 domain-containing protein [Chloroflexi bacterium]|nr:DUF3631 domain-containing protein [Chloroflexota bacterium]